MLAVGIAYVEHGFASRDGGGTCVFSEAPGLLCVR